MAGISGDGLTFFFEYAIMKTRKKILLLEEKELKRSHCFPVLSLVTIMLILILAIPLGVSAEVIGGTCGGESDGSNVLWSLNTETGELIISGSGDMKDYSFGINNDSPFYQNSFVKTITIEEGVTSIGANAFANCENLIEISIPDSVTEISSNTFLNCDALTYTVYGNCKYLGNESNLHAVLVRTVDRSVSSCVIAETARLILDGAFAGCEELTAITIPNSVKSIGNNAFAGCLALQRAILGSGVEQIGQTAFIDCEKLSGISIPSSVRSIGMFAFRGCDRLYQMDQGIYYVDKWVIQYEDPSVSKVTLRSNTVGIACAAFEGYDALQSITLPAGFRSIGDHAFVACENLKTVKLPAGLVNIEADAFSGCEALETLIFCGTEEQWNSLSKAEHWDRGTTDFTVSYHEAVPRANGREICAICGTVLKEAEPETSKELPAETTAPPTDTSAATDPTVNKPVSAVEAEKDRFEKIIPDLLSGCSATVFGSVSLLFLLCGGAAMLTRKKER